ncbi:DUF5630 domain-containing protein [Legionella worsleiensis]|uniref:Ankyrin repeat protein n=1 Tax=Legionella worsleiensis TaxID=45076 RepID=A0A0W1A676_9GAMM|nr:DUF5630 domain-containing protein [Legionella worsleiensis]KTD76820.1 Ankyrin repeat protein [Legionella worsleiensis]STY30682.1 Ankyrin repeat protein [Legionella worsleiensis]
MNKKKSTTEKAVFYLSTDQRSKALEYLERWNNEQLAEFLLNHLSLHEQLKETQYDSFWTNRRMNLRIPGYPDFRFQAQPGISDADFVIGYLLYLLQLKSKKTQSAEDPFFLRVTSSDYLSFHSIRSCLHRAYTSLNKATEADLNKLAEFLYNLEYFAKKHQCPGYLLVAYGYMRLALKYQQLGLSDPCRAAYTLCWKFLHLAALTETQSEASINNAYFGKGIILSTPFELSSISEMKTYCAQVAGGYLSSDDCIGAEKAGLFMYEHLPAVQKPDESTRSVLGL